MGNNSQLIINQLQRCTKKPANDQKLIIFSVTSWTTHMSVNAPRNRSQLVTTFFAADVTEWRQLFKYQYRRSRKMLNDFTIYCTCQGLYLHFIHGGRQKKDFQQGTACYRKNFIFWAFNPFPLCWNLKPFFYSIGEILFLRFLFFHTSQVTPAAIIYQPCQEACFFFYLLDLADST